MSKGDAARRLLQTAVASFLVVIPGAARAADLGPMLSGYVPGPDTDSAWSVFVGGNFETRDNVAGLEGRLFVRGDFNVGVGKNKKKGYVIGRMGGGTGVFPPPGVPVLVTGGDIAGNGCINTPGFPPIQVGSNIAPTVSFIDRGEVIAGGVDHAAADAVLAGLQAKSAWWGSLPDTEGGSIISRWGGLCITADGTNGNPRTWVFNLTFDLPSSSYWGVDFSGFEEGDTILVNCKKTGADETFTLGVNSYVINGVNLNSPFGPKLLWNFPAAKTVTISGNAAFQGSVLVGSPGSVTSVSVPGHHGRFVSCGSVIHCGSSGAMFHNSPFTGVLPDPPPPPAGAIAGRVWEDMDGDGVREEGEPPLAGVTARLLDATGGETAVTVTGGDGRYRFDGLPPGSYSVAFVAPAGMVFTTREAAAATEETGSGADPATGTTAMLELRPGTELPAVDAGLYLPAELHGFVFRDRNGDLLHGPGDAPVADLPVRLAAEGREIASVVTGADGSYRFANVPPGTVTVLVSRIPARPAAVPAEEPAASDPRRNRALPLDADTSFIVCEVTSGLGVSPERPGEPLNIGFVCDCAGSSPSGAPPGHAVRATAIRAQRETLEMSFATQEGLCYRLETRSRLDMPGDTWTPIPTSVRTPDGGWSVFSARPFVAGPGTRTTVRVPDSRKSAFYRLVLITE